MTPLPSLGVFAFAPTGGGDYESISTYTVGSGGASSITFSSIPSTYKHLQIRMTYQVGVSGDQQMQMRFNGDTANNYYQSHYMYGNGSSVVAGSDGVASYINPMYLTGNSSANVFGVGILDILNYGNTNQNKTTRCISGWDKNGSGYPFIKSGLWFSAAAITSINLAVVSGNSWAQYSSFALYGIKG